MCYYSCTKRKSVTRVTGYRIRERRDLPGTQKYCERVAREGPPKEKRQATSSPYTRWRGLLPSRDVMTPTASTPAQTRLNAHGRRPAHGSTRAPFYVARQGRCSAHRSAVLPSVFDGDVSPHDKSSANLLFSTRRKKFLGRLRRICSLPKSSFLFAVVVLHTLVPCMDLVKGEFVPENIRQLRTANFGCVGECGTMLFGYGDEEFCYNPDNNSPWESGTGSPCINANNNVASGQGSGTYGTIGSWNTEKVTSMSYMFFMPSLSIRELLTGMCQEDSTK